MTNERPSAPSTRLWAPAPLRTVALTAIEPVPWKNGGGLTRDLLTGRRGSGPGPRTGPGSRNDADADADAETDPVWRFRISVAEIERDGPFSPYPGVERWFAVVEGAGVELRFDTVVHRLSPLSAPLCFDGTTAPLCRLVDGPTLDLNLLVGHRAGRGVMQAVEDGAPWSSTAPLRAVYTAHAAVLRVDGGPPLALAAHSLAWTDRSGDIPGEPASSAVRPGARWTLEVAPAAPLRAWWLGVDAAPP